MRLQLALNVDDLGASIDYYQKLFGVEPHKRRVGYANFVVEQPALKLVLFENPGAVEKLNHLGVEVLDPDLLEQEGRRLQDAGIVDSVETETTCCHAVQNKYWSSAPNGTRWEWYRITDDTPQTTESSCCVT